MRWNVLSGEGVEVILRMCWSMFTGKVIESWESSVEGRVNVDSVSVFLVISLVGLYEVMLVLYLEGAFVGKVIMYFL